VSLQARARPSVQAELDLHTTADTKTSQKWQQGSSSTCRHMTHTKKLSTAYLRLLVYHLLGIRVPVRCRLSVRCYFLALRLCHGGVEIISAVCAEALAAAARECVRLRKRLCVCVVSANQVGDIQVSQYKCKSRWRHTSVSMQVQIKMETYKCLRKRLCECVVSANQLSDSEKCLVRVRKQQIKQELQRKREGRRRQEWRHTSVLCECACVRVLPGHDWVPLQWTRSCFRSS
jgi:hypothetical protein